MEANHSAKRPMAAAKRKLLDAALSVIRAKGYEATTIDNLCAETGVAKGSFFHHFNNKTALGIGAVDYWSQISDALFAAAPYHGCADPAIRKRTPMERIAMTRAD